MKETQLKSAFLKVELGSSKPEFGVWQRIYTAARKRLATITACTLYGKIRQRREIAIA
jgi:hypothetical protein